MTKEQFFDITLWQEQTFPTANPLSKLAHLKKEVKELIQAIESNDPERRLEFADCLFLIFGAAKADGMTYDDICLALEEKFEIVKKRKWGKPDKDGIVEHID